MRQCEAVLGSASQSVNPSHLSIIITIGRSLPVCRPPPGQPGPVVVKQAGCRHQPDCTHPRPLIGPGLAADQAEQAGTNDAWSGRLTMRCLLGLCFA